MLLRKDGLLKKKIIHIYSQKITKEKTTKKNVKIHDETVDKGNELKGKEKEADKVIDKKASAVAKIEQGDLKQQKDKGKVQITGKDIKELKGKQKSALEAYFNSSIK